MNIHLTYVPYLAAAGELKTKPTQTSVKQLQGQGIQPDILVLRTEHELSDEIRMKVAHFCNVLGYADANSSEMDVRTPHNVIDMMEEQKNITQMGGTMRLGAYDCELVKGSRTWEAYGEQTLIKERHRHRYEFNNRYHDEFQSHGMQCVGLNPAANLVEIVEIPSLRWYIGTQFHPEYSSTVLHPHPLFMDFVKACSDEV